MTPEEIARKQPLWVALSDLFLDTEVRLDLPRAAAEAVKAEIPAPEMIRIFNREVTPVVGWNLLDVAGEWVGFEKEWLTEQIVAGASLPSKALAWTLRGELRNYEKALTHLHHHLTRRPKDLIVLTVLTELYFSTEWRHRLRGLVTLGSFDWPQLESLKDEVLDPAYRPLVWPGDPTPAERERNFTWMRSLWSWCDGRPLPRVQTLEQLTILSDLYHDQGQSETISSAIERLGWSRLEPNPLDQLFA